MTRGCRNFKKGDIIKCLELISDPFKIDGDKNYRGLVKCTLCNSQPFEIVLSEIKRHVFDGCGCQKNRSNSAKWKSFQDWCKETCHEKLLELWDYDLNQTNPDKISWCTYDEYYFKCGCSIHPSSVYSIYNLTAWGKTKEICRYCNSFAQYAIDKFGKDVLDIYWDYEKNTADPWLISHASKDSIWVKCTKTLEHGSHKIRPHLFLKGIGCPICAYEQKNSKLQEKVDYYLTDILKLDVQHERQCSLIAVNPKNGYKLPYDNDVTVNKCHLIVEVHGVQHYDVNNGWILKTAKKYNISPEQTLSDLQWRDEYKKQYAISQGYHYLAIPYWTENDESYKTIIDQKIKEILTIQN